MINNDSIKTPVGSSSKNKPKVRKRRRFRLILFILFLCLAILIWSAPYLASSKTGSDLLVGFLNKNSDKRVQINKLSVTWLGPCRIEGVKIWDSQNREILQLAHTTLDKGVWQVLGERKNFEKVTLQTPQLILYLSEEKSQSTAPFTLPEINGQITVHDGGLSLVYPDGQTLVISQMETQLELNAVKHINGTPSLQLNGQSTITGFTCDKPPFSEKNITLSYQDVNISSDDCTIKNIQMDSPNFSLRLTGNIKDLQSSCQLDLKGSYQGSWEKITALIDEFAPDTAQTFAFTGTTGGDFSLTGPARQPDIQPAYRDVNAALDIGWTTGNIYGLELGETKLSPILTDGRIKFADANIPAGGGSILLDGLIVDLHSEEPAVQILQNLPVLRNIQINADFARQMLSRVNPIFTDLAAMDGVISLNLENVNLPLSDQIKKTGTGRGHIDLSKMRVRPEGLLAELLRLGGIDTQKSQSLKVPSIDFAIRQGRIYYDNFIIAFEDKFELKFYGSVGFDDTLDLVVSVPMRVALLEKFGIKGPSREYVRLLADTRIDIPLIGTRLEPKLDFTKVDIQPIIDKAAEAVIKDKTSEVLDKIFKPKRPRQPEPEKPREKTESETVEQQIFDIFIDILEEKIKKD